MVSEVRLECVDGDIGSGVCGRLIEKLCEKIDGLLEWTMKS